MAAMEMVKDGRTVMVQDEEVAEWKKRGYLVLGRFPYTPGDQQPAAETAAPAKKPTTRKE